MRRPFNRLKSAWEAGRAIVPLYGAGVSVSSGIPSTHGLQDYLAKLIFYREWLPALTDKIDEGPLSSSILKTARLVPRQVLTTTDWPSAAQLDSDLLLLANDPVFGPEVDGILAWAGATDLREPVIDRIVRMVTDDLREEANPHLPSVLAGLRHETSRKVLASLQVGWATLLSRVTRDRPEEIDSFFDRIVSAREPGSAHLYNAFLTELLDMRLILTTNFDDLLERALRDQHVDHQVFEIQSGARLPDRDLIRAHRSVVKLHGGSHGLRADASLDHEMRGDDLVTLRGYVPENALLLVIGYSGADARVMSLIRSWCETNNDGTPGRVLWVHREELPPEPVHELAEKLGVSLDEQNSPIETMSYPDAGLFLQEAYERLASAHPPSDKPFRLLPQVPPWVPPQLKGKAVATDPERPVHVFHADGAGRGASTLLARFAQQFENSHRLIWIDLEEVPSIASLGVVLLEELRRYDTELPAIFLSTAIEPTSDPASADRAPPPLADAIRRRIAQGLRRGRYLVAIDSVCEFVQKLPEAHRGSELQRLYDFVYYLATELSGKGAWPLAASKLAVAHTRPEAPLAHAWVEHRKKLKTEMTESVELVESGGSGAVPVTDLDPRQEAAWRELLGDEGPRIAEGASNILEILTEHRESIRERQPECWSILCVASAFRRPRSIVALRSVMHALRALFPTGGSEHGSDLEDALDTLTGARIMIQRAGGFYWIHRRIRDVVHDWTARECPDLIADLHERIAWYYLEDAFLPSRDVQAFFEYAHHRIESAKASLPLSTRDRQELVDAIGGVIKDATRNPEFQATASEHVALSSPQIQAACADAIAALDDPHADRAAEMHGRGTDGTLELVLEHAFGALLADRRSQIALGLAAAANQDAVRRAKASLIEATQTSLRGATPRFRALFQCLQRERTFLLSQGHSEMLRGWLAEIEQGLAQCVPRAESLPDGNKEKVSFLKLYEQIKGGLSDLDATVSREVAGFDEARRIRSRQLVDLAKALHVPLPPETLEEGDPEQILAPIVRLLNEPSLVDASPSLLPAVTGGREGERELVAIKFARIALELGVCLSGQRCFPMASQWFAEIAKLADEVSRSTDPRVRDEGLNLGIQVNLRLMANALNRIDPNDTQGAVADQAVELERARQSFNEGMKMIRAYPDTARRNPAPYRRGYYTERARAILLEGGGNHHVRAPQHLNRARATAYREDRPGSLIGLAIIDLRRAEGLISEGRAASSEPRAHQLFVRAFKCLSVAERRLASARRNVWWWTLKCTLAATLYCELFSLWNRAGDVLRATGIADPPKELWLHEGIAQVSSGFDNIQTDRIRAKRLSDALEALRQAARTLSDSSSAGEQEWKRALTRAELKAPRVLGGEAEW